MLGVVGEKKPAAQFKDMAALMDQLAAKAEKLEESATAEAVKALAASVCQQVEAMKAAVDTLGAHVANAKPAVVNVPAADNKALMTAIAKIGQPKPYRFSVTERDKNGRISEAVLRPE